MKFARLALIALSVFVTSCAAFTPDVYVGDGMWQRGDGTTYEAPSPIQVVSVEVCRSRLIVNQPSSSDVNLDSHPVVEVSMTVQVNLADGTSHDVVLRCRGAVDTSSWARGTFTAVNNRPYDVRARVHLGERHASADVTVSSLGPVRFQTNVETY